MAKSIAKQPKHEQVDTDDRIMESVASATLWAKRDRRAATTGLIALVAVIGAGVIYVRYKADLQERAAVRLDQLRLSSQGVAPDQFRQDLGEFIAQYGSTPEAGEARLMLAEYELRRDSIDAAIRVLEPVVSSGVGTPIGYHGATMIAAAQDRKGDTRAAMRSFERLETDSRYGYQRRAARAARARLHEFSGEYAQAEQIYMELAADVDAATDGAFYAVHLGEVRARAKAQLPAPAVPVIEPRTSANPGGDDPVPAEPAMPEE
ncbi:MAG: tetratricopeptide repeat protein [Gemmatimonadales bacterium]|nr:MAG: tetratricopeptide repeat protein [Gemmatimonadales bacterium]